jgi:hypothetical protein
LVPDGKTLTGSAVKIVFRTDASVQIGAGHVMRCLTLADTLRQQGAECTFVCRSHEGNFSDVIRECGHQVIALAVGQPIESRAKKTWPEHAAWLGTDWVIDATQTQQAIGSQTVDWLIVDHYALDHRWEHSMRTYCKHLMVIDDLADRLHDCDLLLDQNFGRNLQDYSQLTPDTTIKLIGAQHALLRPEFAALREASLARRSHPQLKHLLITMGGVDKDNVTSKVLMALRQCALPDSCDITVIMGSGAPWFADVQMQAKQMPWPTQVLFNVKNMAEVMASSDLAIGAAGSSSWERCCLGLPTLVMVLAENQRKTAMQLDGIGAARLVSGAQGEALINALDEAFFDFTKNQAALRKMVDASMHITNGLGAQLVSAQIQSSTLSNTGSL